MNKGKGKGPSAGKSVIIDRWRAIGEDLIPAEEFYSLTGEEFDIWLTEPDPNRFPPSMHHLLKYFDDWDEDDISGVEIREV